jgi:hypothetical protein
MRLLHRRDSAQVTVLRWLQQQQGARLVAPIMAAYVYPRGPQRGTSFGQSLKRLDTSHRSWFVSH